MAWNIFKKQPTEAEVLASEYETEKQRFSAMSYKPIFNVSFDGEKTPGEIGIIRNYAIDFSALRARSWQSYLESEISQTVINKFITWIIGSGLKLQSEPIEEILKLNGINIDRETFSKMNELKFGLYSRNKKCDYSKINSLNKIAFEVKKQALIGGDCLVILRIVNKKLEIQLIDGDNIETPFNNTKEVQADNKAKNTILNGIVSNKKGEQIAFYVRESFDSYKRIEATINDGMFEQAFMVYGLKYKLKNNRGIPLISSSLETLKKLDRYKEAAVASAEEVAKIAYTIEHGNNSTGENPLANQLKASLGLDNEDLKDDGSQVANKIAATTQKEVFNLPVDSKITTLDSKNNLHFKEFYSVNVNAVCSSLGIPPEVALSMYDSNFSASRAALKDWEHTLNVNRNDISFQFYQKVFSFWFRNEVINDKIKAPGFFEALVSGDDEIVDSYENARFVGANVPHIDPLKEVNAERAKLGPLGANLPLTTLEAATEALNGGEFDSNQKQFTQEVESFKLEDPKLKLEAEAKAKEEKEIKKTEE